ncbi:hypothetical protein RJ640_010708 [Escallonia rubra]|uniref:GAG-pre-integrase domain-containing protein n=1 Tax=Escallonia rubra TaxID=112253 RepID=A0AA88ULM4_9ASTE|nr:hypothetical protein RJ640_010708 [Escallonia rubra]
MEVRISRSVAAGGLVAMVKESLRLHPTLPLLFRKYKENYKIRGYDMLIFSQLLSVLQMERGFLIRVAPITYAPVGASLPFIAHLMVAKFLWETMSLGRTITGAAATTSSFGIDSDTTKLRHMCLGLMSVRGMDVLSKKVLLGSKKTGKLDFCEHSVFKKQCRVKFSRAVHTTKVISTANEHHTTKSLKACPPPCLICKIMGKHSEDGTRVRITAKY